MADLDELLARADAWLDGSHPDERRGVDLLVDDLADALRAVLAAQPEPLAILTELMSDDRAVAGMPNDLYRRALEVVAPPAAAGSTTPTEPKGNGMCHPASDFIACAPTGAIAYAHPECPLHGDPAAAGSATPEEDT